MFSLCTETTTKEEHTTERMVIPSSSQCNDGCSIAGMTLIFGITLTSSTV